MLNGRIRNQLVVQGDKGSRYRQEPTDGFCKETVQPMGTEVVSLEYMDIMMHLQSYKLKLLLPKYSSPSLCGELDYRVAVLARTYVGVMLVE
jgi:hypothetical protein